MRYGCWTGCEVAVSVSIMGIVNVTPDSFSDGGRYYEAKAAIAHGLDLVAEGADIIDVGGESTRPGALEVPEREELRRVIPVVEALSEAVRVSIDTRKAAVAQAAVRAGATIVNDVTGWLGPVAGECGVAWVAMHSQGDPQTMQIAPTYADVVSEVAGYLEERLTIASRYGVDEVYLDPGIGFGKTAEHNLQLLAKLDRITSLGAPVLVGLSRKSFLATLSPFGAAGSPLEREDQTLGANIAAVMAGARVIRVHEVRPLRHFLDLIKAMGA